MCVLHYAMAKSSFRMMGRMFKKNHSLIYRWVRAFGSTLPEPKISGKIKEMEFDELWYFIGSKKKLWVIKAIDRCTRQTATWVLGGRDSATFRKLYDKVKHLKDCAFWGCIFWRVVTDR